MKIAVSATGRDLDAQMDRGFGRARHFILIDTATGDFQVLDNDAAGESRAGLSAAKMIANSGAQVLITGNVGPNAIKILQAAGLKVYPGAAGTVREALAQFEAGKLREGTESSAKGGGRGRAPGGGAGRGRGAGQGRGVGGKARRGA